ncbi:small GTP-binding protein [Calothrix sp. 336/3]|nr:small GTP-binding protein [Calothrix sp. 336/3]
MIGDFGVGKTSLIRRFVDGEFSDQYLATVGVKISRKVITTDIKSPSSNSLQLIIWDVEGSQKFKGIAPNYLQGARGAVIVADMTRSETIKNLRQHIQQFLSINPQACVIIALNKADLIELEYTEKAIQECQSLLSTQITATYLTSAKTGNNVDEIFTELAHKLILL